MKNVSLICEQISECRQIVRQLKEARAATMRQTRNGSASFYILACINQPKEFVDEGHHHPDFCVQAGYTSDGNVGK